MPTETTDLAVQRIDPMQMIQKAFESAIEHGAGLEVVDRILAQQREMMEYNDRARFQAALRRIQDKLKRIPKRGWNPETKSHYPLAQDVDEALNTLLQQEGMVLSFEPRPSDKVDEVIIVGILSLEAYSKEYPLPMPADGKGAKGGGVMSRTHATGSAITYGKRYLKDMIFNLGFLEKDDDGNKAGATEPMDEKVFASHMEKIQGADSKDSLQAAFLAATKAARDAKDAGAARSFEKAKNDTWRSNGGYR
jgi:hypothetical protein